VVIGLNKKATYDTPMTDCQNTYDTTPDWLTKNRKQRKMNELITLTQAEKVHGLYEYFLNGKSVMFRLLAKESDTHSMAKEMIRATNEKRKVLLIVE